MSSIVQLEVTRIDDNERVSTMIETRSADEAFAETMCFGRLWECRFLRTTPTEEAGRQQHDETVKAVRRALPFYQRGRVAGGALYRTARAILGAHRASAYAMGLGRRRLFELASVDAWGSDDGGPSYVESIAKKNGGAL